ncbi:MAG: hypothetical protein V1495_11465 [Pseudomonadota bacterium]
MEQRVKGLFRQAEQVPLEPSPFLKTRVLAHVREARAKTVGFRWKMWALASSTASLLLLSVLFWPARSSLTALVDQRVLVRVEVEALEGSNVAYATVELPDGVSFVSTKYPEIQKAHEVRLAWMPEFENRGLPVVVRATSVGKKTIRIFLFDRNDTVLKAKEVTITFRGAA